MSIAPGAMLRVVLDTNIYIASVTSPDGPNSRVWAAASKGRYVLLSSAAIISELARVLRHDFARPESLIQDRVKLIARIAEMVPVGPTLNLIRADPSDNRILECAVNGKADLIVSNDRHLLDLRTCRSIPIIAGPDFRRTLGLR